MTEICMLVHLRFLNIQTEVKSLPSFFSNLWNLETLSLDNGNQPMLLLPLLEDSALEIKKYVEDMMGEDKVQVRKRM